MSTPVELEIAALKRRILAGDSAEAIAGLVEALLLRSAKRLEAAEARERRTGEECTRLEAANAAFRSKCEEQARLIATLRGEVKIERERAGE